ncbi:antA/AntB antirepressor family protein [Roseateles sp. SL47]|uniref:antA/AntB antirepressor family protein n=1 Tax=Roseateles sp. SL47 TaxID=2995138 RepID=UPI00227093AA|nr:antA/AntB antirepressor family protein [Roseateles sp. SL47]WAC75327.1 antA/AntB antirepressor family protein [Roseateles sp. SL47]
MNELIQITSATIGGVAVQTVNARDLYSFLEVGKDFSTWMKDRIAQYGFVEHEDYEVAHELSSPVSGSSMARPQRTVAYHISVDMAKELAMVERTEKGKQARQYFIQCERVAQGFTAPPGAGSPVVVAATDATAVFSFMRVIGLDQNAAAISANQAAYAVHGVNLLQLSGNTHLLAANQETQALTPTALGKLLGGLSAQKVNRALEQAGLQKRVGDEWVPLPAAEGLYRLFDTGKKHSSGTPVTQLKWYAASADRLKRSA